MIIDWVPAHFPRDDHGLARFDGTRALRARGPAPRRAHRLGHADLQLRPPRGAQLPGRERAVLARPSTTSTACAWTRWPRCSTSTTAARPGEWVPNRYGGRENLEAIDFLRQLNDAVGREHPGRADVRRGVDGVARRDAGPCTSAGSGFHFKWNMGWMNDTLRYVEQRPGAPPLPPRRPDRSRCIYACTENFVLPLSHDEVVHGKGSLLDKMPGDEWQKRANLRAAAAPT
ncbi:MAG: hypothetical protein MZV65_25855 [Chromatiales bacterium]|nr:hypothetical protein [Chromatiales bacterium]